MRKDRTKAEQLRRTGKSYKHIFRELGIPISTLATWFKNEPWSVEIRNRLASVESFSYPEKLKRLKEAIKKKYTALYKSYRDTAEKEFTILKSNYLFLAGVMLYWGEGDKSVKNSHLKLTNSDPGMIRVYYKFLKECLGIPEEKIKAGLILYPDLVESVQKNFWSKATGISINSCWKATYIKGKHPTKRLSYGVCMVNVGSRLHKEKMLKWIELYQEKFYTPET